VSYIGDNMFHKGQVVRIVKEGYFDDNHLPEITLYDTFLVVDYKENKGILKDGSIVVRHLKSNKILGPYQNVTQFDGNPYWAAHRFEAL
jgi:hypothetical protein